MRLSANCTKFSAKAQVRRQLESASLPGVLAPKESVPDRLTSLDFMAATVVTKLIIGVRPTTARALAEQIERQSPDAVREQEGPRLIKC
jgi:hypothetical protein